MSLEKEMFEEQKGEWIKEGYNEEELDQCDRCYKVEPHEFLRSKYGDQNYCECCYEDLFVSWGEAFKR